MELFKCNSCKDLYYSDAHEGFDCRCGGTIIKVEDEELLLPGNFRADFDHPCVSC